MNVKSNTSQRKKLASQESQYHEGEEVENNNLHDAHTNFEKGQQ
jgi:hypothetical protein